MMAAQPCMGSRRSDAYSDRRRRNRVGVSQAVFHDGGALGLLLVVMHGRDAGLAGRLPDVSSPPATLAAFTLSATFGGRRRRGIGGFREHRKHMPEGPPQQPDFGFILLRPLRRIRLKSGLSFFVRPALISGAGLGLSPLRCCPGTLRLSGMIARFPA
jgi:hypothetical protein